MSCSLSRFKIWLERATSGEAKGLYALMEGFEPVWIDQFGTVGVMALWLVFVSVVVWLIQGSLREDEERQRKDLNTSGLSDSGAKNVEKLA